jgi:hypothetical protein
VNKVGLGVIDIEKGFRDTSVQPPTSNMTPRRGKCSDVPLATKVQRSKKWFYWSPHLPNSHDGGAVESIRGGRAGIQCEGCPPFQ